MRLIFIRHADPDYAIDSLTRQGWKEAEYLGERMAKEKMDYIYVSPLGRAQDTASFTLEETGMKAETKEWLKEFDPRINRPDRHAACNAWDWMPADWTQRPIFFDKDHWAEDPIMRAGKVKERYDWVIDNFDALLKEHGYERNGLTYKVNKGSHDTLVFFCHFGLECVIMSHLMNVSPMILWHGMVSAPTGVTIFHSEERQKGIASFRASCFSDTSHLYAHGEKPSFAARYSECFEDDTKH